MKPRSKQTPLATLYTLWIHINQPCDNFIPHADSSSSFRIRPPVSYLTKRRRTKKLGQSETIAHE